MIEKRDWMSEFVIEYELEKVTSITTKEYLKEVISSYNSGNYRSTIVVLYSVVIFDLLEKVKILSEIYHDEKATEILESIKTMEGDETTYSSREKFLVKAVKDKTVLLNDIEYGKLQHLRENRNWCAHPVHNQDYKLINPTKEEARAFIRISFEIIFQKEALLSRKVLDDILQTSYDYYDKMQLDGLKNYLNDKFYSKMNQGVKDKTFESLWKIVFMLNDEQCIKTRHSSYYALLFLININPEHYYGIVKNDTQRYSNIQMPENKIEFESYHASISNSPAEALIFMLSEHPKLYNNMTEASRAIINTIAPKNITYLTVSYYLSESMENHLSKIIDKRDSIYIMANGYCDTSKYDIFAHDDLLLLYKKALELGCDDVVKDFIINHFVHSPSYNNTDYIWSFVYPIINTFTGDELKTLLNGMNNNSQIHGSRNKNSIMYDLNRYYKTSTNRDLDLTDYPNLR